MAGTRIIGMDIGSRSIEMILWQEERIFDQTMVPTTYDPINQCRRILQGRQAEKIVVTGYGRKLFAASFTDFSVQTLTEIQAYALGARFLFPEARTVLDIGGQDTKVVRLNDTGKVAKFEMNDRCAAGTGKFLEFMATALQIPLEEFGAFALRAEKRITINSMCTVFAESEATSLMARGETPENIAMGLHRAIVQRTLSMLERVGLEAPLVFAGGVAHNPCIRALLAEALPFPLYIPEQPDMVGAIGAALYGRSSLVGS